MSLLLRLATRLLLLTSLAADDNDKLLSCTDQIQDGFDPGKNWVRPGIYRWNEIGWRADYSLLVKGDGSFTLERRTHQLPGAEAPSYGPFYVKGRWAVVDGREAREGEVPLHACKVIFDSELRPPEGTSLEYDSDPVGEFEQRRYSVDISTEAGAVKLWYAGVQLAEPVELLTGHVWKDEFRAREAAVKDGADPQAKWNAAFFEEAEKKGRGVPLMLQALSAGALGVLAGEVGGAEGRKSRLEAEQEHFREFCRHGQDHSTLSRSIPKKAYPEILAQLRAVPDDVSWQVQWAQETVEVYGPRSLENGAAYDEIPFSSWQTLIQRPTIVSALKSGDHHHRSNFGRPHRTAVIVGSALGDQSLFFLASGIQSTGYDLLGKSMVGKAMNIIRSGLQKFKLTPPDSEFMQKECDLLDLSADEQRKMTPAEQADRASYKKVFGLQIENGGRPYQMTGVQIDDGSTVLLPDNVGLLWLNDRALPVETVTHMLRRAGFLLSVGSIVVSFAPQGLGPPPHDPNVNTDDFRIHFIPLCLIERTRVETSWHKQAEVLIYQKIDHLTMCKPLEPNGLPACIATGYQRASKQVVIGEELVEVGQRFLPDPGIYRWEYRRDVPGDDWSARVIVSYSFHLHKDASFVLERRIDKGGTAAEPEIKGFYVRGDVAPQGSECKFVFKTDPPEKITLTAAESRSSHHHTFFQLQSEKLPADVVELKTSALLEEEFRIRAAADGKDATPQDSWIASLFLEAEYPGRGLKPMRAALAAGAAGPLASEGDLGHQREARLKTELSEFKTFCSKGAGHVMSILPAVLEELRHVPENPDWQASWGEETVKVSGARQMGTQYGELPFSSWQNIMSRPAVVNALDAANGNRRAVIIGSSLGDQSLFFLAHDVPSKGYDILPQSMVKKSMATAEKFGLDRADFDQQASVVVQGVGPRSGTVEGGGLPYPISSKRLDGHVTLTSDVGLLWLNGRAEEGLPPKAITAILQAAADILVDGSVVISFSSAIDQKEADHEEIVRPPSLCLIEALRVKTSWRESELVRIMMKTDNPGDCHPHKIPGANDCNLMGPFGLLIQTLIVVLCAIALITVWMNEKPRRPFLTWAFDISKQVVGAAYGKGYNVLQSLYFAADPNAGSDECVWYLVGMVADCVIVTFLSWGLVSCLRPILQWRYGIDIGVYGSTADEGASRRPRRPPPECLRGSLQMWSAQVAIWLGIITVVRVFMTIFLSIFKDDLYNIFAGLFAVFGMQFREAKTVFAVLLFPAFGDIFQMVLQDYFLKRQVTKDDRRSSLRSNSPRGVELHVTWRASNEVPELSRPYGLTI